MENVHFLYLANCALSSPVGRVVPASTSDGWPKVSVTIAPSMISELIVSVNVLAIATTPSH